MKLAALPSEDKLLEHPALQAAEAGAKAIQPEHVQKALESVPCVPALEAGPRHPTSTHNP